MQNDNFKLEYRHLPLREANRRELAALDQAATALPGDKILPEIREAMMQRYPVVDDDELVIIRKSQVPLGAWVGLCQHIPRGTPAQLVEDEEGPALVVERSILDMILDALGAVIQAILGMLSGERSGPPRAGNPRQSSGGKPSPGRRSPLLIEHDGPDF